MRDNGEGLTPEEQARLFVPFERLDQMRVEGHGLGLSIVRRIVERLEGRVGIDSEVGRAVSSGLRCPCLRLPQRGNSPAHGPIRDVQMALQLLLDV